MGLAAHHSRAELAHLHFHGATADEAFEQTVIFFVPLRHDLAFCHESVVRDRTFGDPHQFGEYATTTRQRLVNGPVRPFHLVLAHRDHKGIFMRLVHPEMDFEIAADPGLLVRGHIVPAGFESACCDDLVWRRANLNIRGRSGSLRACFCVDVRIDEWFGDGAHIGRGTCVRGEIGVGEKTGVGEGMSIGVGISRRIDSSLGTAGLVACARCERSTGLANCSFALGINTHVTCLDSDHLQLTLLGSPSLLHSGKLTISGSEEILPPDLVIGVPALIPCSIAIRSVSHRAATA